MFGLYRTFLALMVVALHIGGVPMTGVYAVFGFYVLSGYLMTLIMHNSYGYTATGFYRYALNRFLRIYPVYWVSIIFSAVLIWCLGSSFTSSYHPSMHFPAGALGWAKNLLLFFPKGSISRLTPPTWALTVEIFFYILIGLGISKSRRLTLFWFFGSAAYHFGTLFLQPDWSYRYYSISAASLPFSTGALLFHHMPSVTKWRDPESGALRYYLPYIVTFLILINWFLGYVLEQSTGFFFYSNYALCTLMTAALYDRKQLPYVSREIDKWVGEFSYPIYLLHYQVGIVVIALLAAFGIELSRPSLVLMAVSMPLLFICSWAVLATLAKPIESVRARVRG
ncbi:MAG: acyltransferase [Nodosilinea sp.]